MATIDTTAPKSDAGEPTDLTRLFDAVLQFTSDSPDDVVIQVDARDGLYIGSGNGTVTGEHLRGTMAWSLYAGKCLYPRIRRGEAVPSDLHLCTMTLGGFIDTHDGARLSFDGRGYGLRSREWYRWSASLAFRSEGSRYDWLTRTLAVMTGDFDEKAGRIDWQVFARNPAGR